MLMRSSFALLLAVSLSGQNFVEVPAVLAGVPAPETTIYPAGHTYPSRVQNLYAPGAVGLGAPVVINRIDIRSEETLPQAGKTFFLSVAMARGVLPPASTRTFASNYSSAATTVFTLGPVNVTPAPSQSPGPYPIALPLSTSYPYFPLPTASLLVDFDSPNPSVGTHFHDAPWAGVTASTFTTQAVVATGCVPTATVTNFTSPGTVTWNWSGVSSAATGSFLFLGTTQSATPISVFPFTLSCPFHVELVCAPFVWSGGIAAGPGAWTLSAPVPAALNRPDTRIVTQWISWPPAPTVQTSPAHELVFNGTDAVCRVYSSCTSTSSAGTRQLGTSNVLRIYF